MVTLLSGLVVIINNKPPKHNEVVSDNRKSIMHENTPVIYCNVRHPHTAGFKACLETTLKDQEVSVYKLPLQRLKTLTEFTFTV